MTYEYLASCAAEGAVYVELTASPDHAAAVGLSDAEHYGGIAEGIDDARREHGIEARILAAVIRNFGVEARRGIARRPRRGATRTSSASTWSATRPAYPPGPFLAAYEIAPAAGWAAPSTPASTPARGRCAPRSPCR